MIATARLRLRDVFQTYSPVWLRNRPGFTSGYNFLWAVVAPLDDALQFTIEGISAAWPGIGTPTALPWIGRSRGILRGQVDTDADYAARLGAWLDTWRAAGSSLAIAHGIRDYLRSHPRVRIVTRSGYWVTLEQDGTITRQSAPWNWDGVSHPERATWWSEIWIIVYPVQWQTTGTLGQPGAKIGRSTGIGHLVTREEDDAIRGQIAQWKSAHTLVRAIIWTSDPTLFDPANPASCPDGTWGAWGIRGPRARAPSGRNTTTCRYWEP